MQQIHPKSKVKNDSVAVYVPSSFAINTLNVAQQSFTFSTLNTLENVSGSAVLVVGALQGVVPLLLHVYRITGLVL